MRLQWLEDYEAKELNVSVKLDLEEEIGKRPVSIRMFYPELELKENDLYSNWMYVPVWAQLPYYEKLIVPVIPVRDIATFERQYGLIPETLVALAKQTKRIQFLLTWQPTDFAGLEYLDPILQLRPPSTPVREHAFYHNLMNEKQVDQIYARSERFGSQMFSKLRFHRKYFYTSCNFSPSKVIKNGIERMVTHLIAFGYRQIVDSLAKFMEDYPDRVDDAYTALYLYALFLCGPYVSALNGVFVTGDEFLKDLDVVGIEAPSQVFPADVGELLAEKLMLAPTKSLDEALDVYPNYAKARDALRKLDSFVSSWEWYKKVTGESSEILSSRKAVLKATWNETTASLKSWPKDVRNVKAMIEEGVVLGSVSIGVLGSLALNLPATSGILATILSKYVGDLFKRNVAKVTPSVSEKLVRFYKPSHTTAIMSIIREWDPAQKQIFGKGKL